MNQRTVLVTGGNRGIGYSIAEEFLKNGYQVAVTARSGEGPEGVLTVHAEMTDSGSLQAAVKEVEEKLGPITILVANAGITKDTLLMRMSDDDFEQVVDVNLSGAFRATKACIRSMVKARFGRIIYISSVVGFYGSPGQVNYSASKSGLLGMARSVTRELGSRGITANLITPGFIETDMTNELDESLQKQYLASIPAARYGRAEEVAKAAVWLASDSAGYISGSVIPVDGGLGMGH